MADLLGEAPRRTPRYVLSLVEWIPPDGAVAASVQGGAHWLGWTRSTELLAATWDLHAAVAAAQAGSKRKRPPKAPTYPRPKAPKRAAPAGDRPRARRRLADFAKALRPADY